MALDFSEDAGGDELDQVPPGARLEVSIDVTERCNLRCAYCYFGEKGARTIEVPTVLDVLERLSDEITAGGGVTLYLMGAEPMLAFPRIKEIVSAAQEVATQRGWDIRFSVTSNLTRLTEEATRFFLENRVRVHSSIDGPPEIQRESRPGPDTDYTGWHEKVARALRTNPKDSARLTVTPENVGRLVDSLEYVAELGFVNIAAIPAFTKGVIWDEAAVARLTEQVQRLATRRTTEPLAGVQWISPFDKSMNLAAGVGPEVSASPHCGAGRRLVAADIDGNLFPCFRLTKNGSGFQLTKPGDAVVAHNFPLERHEICRACPIESICIGGCWAEGIMLSNDPQALPPGYCKVYLAIHEAFLGANPTPIEKTGATCITCTACAGCDSDGQWD